MKKLFAWIGVVLLLLIAGGYLRDVFMNKPAMYYPPVMVTIMPSGTGLPVAAENSPKAIATALLDPTPLPVMPVLTPIPPMPVVQPTGLPDYIPGQGGAVLAGNGPYAINLLPGGWQAYQIGPSSRQYGYVVDITPLEDAVDGAHIEWKILPEYSGIQWVDVLWLRSPEIVQSLPVFVDLIPTENWKKAFKADATLLPGEWMGFAMFPLSIDQPGRAAGVLDVNVTTPNQTLGTAIQAYRVQPEFPGEWLQVARVQLTGTDRKLDASLVYYTPTDQAEQILHLETTLMPGVWTGWPVALSSERQGYLVEVIPLEDVDNEISLVVVQPEFDGMEWQDVLRIMIPESRPRLDTVINVYAVRVIQP